MEVVTLEAVVENGVIRLPSHPRLPDQTRVYVVVPEAVIEPAGRIVSPRLVRPEAAAGFELEVVQGEPLEDYFDFLAPDDIRIRGHRIGVETVLDEYLRKGRRPEEIVESYPTLRLDEIYATILYYLRNREALDRYLAGWREFGREARARQRRDPPPAVLRLRGRLPQSPASR